MARVLFIDDDPYTLETLSKAISLFGHQALVTGSGMQGLLIATNEIPDIIFTDIRLSDMDGLQLVRTLKETPETARIPVLILSASPMVDAQDLAKTAGAQAYFTKPIRLQSLLDTIREYTMQNDKP